MCRTTDLWVWLPVWTGPAEAQNGLVWNVEVMLIILGMWTHHTQKGRFSLQCHKEVSKNLLKNLAYKSFWIFSPNFQSQAWQPLPRTGGSCRAVTDSCRAPHTLKHLWMCILLLHLGQSCTKCKSFTLLCISTAESARGEVLHLWLQRGGGTPQKNCPCSPDLWSVHICWGSDFVQEKWKYLCQI